MNVPGFLEDALHQGICEVAAQEDVVRLDRDLDPGSLCFQPLRLGGRGRVPTETQIVPRLVLGFQATFRIALALRLALAAGRRGPVRLELSLSARMRRFLARRFSLVVRLCQAPASNTSVPPAVCVVTIGFLRRLRRPTPPRHWPGSSQKAVSWTRACSDAIHGLLASQIGVPFATSAEILNRILAHFSPREVPSEG